jgi:putative CocE/NonD family hydrolase
MMRSARAVLRPIAMAALWVLLSLPGPSLPSDLPNDIPDKFEASNESFDFIRRDAMIPMRDGVKLHTVILVPKGAHAAPILLTRTPYGATRSTTLNHSTHMTSVLPRGDDILSMSGYVRVFQDVRGKYDSEGAYVMARPIRGALNDSATDHSTDTWDTIEWLTKNVPESNKRVGLMGTSYEGFLVLMGLVNPHPALKVAVAVAPMVDVWRGDDWFHNGAFRQLYALDYFYKQTGTRKSEDTLSRSKYDEYDTFLDAGSPVELARRTGADRLPFWQRLVQHPAYDPFWQQQALDRILASKPLTVPTMYVVGLWDQEDIYGATAAYAATEPKDGGEKRNFLVLGPWNHGGSNRDGSSLGALRFEGDTALWFRRDIAQPFLDQYLKDRAPKADTPAVLAYETGTDRWRRYDRWPQSCEQGCTGVLQPLYLGKAGTLSFQSPDSAASAFDEYVSDPAKPVPYRLRPLLPVSAPDSSWGQWLVDDQRNFSDRPDVLVYTTPVLGEPVRIAGRPIVHLHASTSGTDSDWVVKLIDVYPDEVSRQPALGGYQLMIAADIFRGRYRESLERATPIPAGKIQEYRFALPNANHVFLPGHRIMVQVQSSWFPLYDRNPQTFVNSIFQARPEDYRKATQRVYYGAASASHLDLPVLPFETVGIASALK